MTMQQPEFGKPCSCASGVDALVCNCSGMTPLDSAALELLQVAFQDSVDFGDLAQAAAAFLLQWHRTGRPAEQLFPPVDSRPIPNGAHRSVRGSKGFYTVCNHGGRLFCDCPSFAFSKEPQSCKHVLGLAPAQYGKKG